MSDAKKCDRCGEYYTMGANNDIRPLCNGVRIFGVRYISPKQNLDAVDLCPKCTAKVWKYISEYDEPAEDEGADVVYANNKEYYKKPAKPREWDADNICNSCAFNTRTGYHYEICDNCYKGGQFVPKKEENEDE